MADSKTKKHKVSKKTKKSWRKHIDIKDVDAFLDDKRLEERLGISFSEYSDSQLFVVDNTANTIERDITSTRATKLALITKEPKCFASLKPHTQVPDPISVRNRVKTKEERINFVLWQCRAEKKMKNIFKLKEKKALKNKVLAKAASTMYPEEGEIKNDIWDSTADPLPKTITKWMSADSIRHTIKHLGVKKRKLPSLLLKKPSILPAVENPHPGTSYNPSYADHQELLHEATRKELEFIKQQQHLDRVTTQMFKKIPVNKRDDYLMKEMSEGLPTKNQFATNLNSTEDKEDLPFATTNNKPVKNTKKTLVQKRKQREQKQASNERSLIKLEKKKHSDIYKLKILQKQIEAKEKQQEFLRQKRLKKEEEKSILPKTLGKTKFEPLDLDFQLAEELTGNLRNCKSSTNLLKDRYKSLQQRNIIAPAIIKLTRDKAKVKKFVKPDHKINV